MFSYYLIVLFTWYMYWNHSLIDMRFGGSTVDWIEMCAIKF